MATNNISELVPTVVYESVGSLLVHLVPVVVLEAQGITVQELVVAVVYEEPLPEPEPSPRVKRQPVMFT